MRRSLPALASASVAVAFLVLPSFAFAATTWSVAKTGSDSNDCTSLATACLTIQAAINKAAGGDTIQVYPGSYQETAPGSTLTPANGGGTYTFGLFLPDSKASLTIEGVTAGGVAITNAASVVADVTTVGDADFGPDGIMVEGANDTIQGLKINGNLDPTSLTESDNKTIEVIGDNFTLQYSTTNVPGGGGSVYIDDFSSGGTVVKSYHILDNIFHDGTSVDIASGAGNTGAATGREILRNDWDLQNNGFNAISFNGAGGVPWFVNPVGGAVIKNNSFKNSTQYIRQRGTVSDQTQFNWQSYWNDNTFDKAVIALDNPATFDVRSYTYTSAPYTFTNVRRIGSSIQGEIKDSSGVDHAQAGDTLLVKAGSYPENVSVDRSLTIKGAEAAVAVAGRTFNSANESTIAGQTDGIGTITLTASTTLDGFSITNVRTAFSSSGVVVKTGADGSAIDNNIFDTITTQDTTANGTAQAVYFGSATNGVHIAGNKMNNIHSNRSAKGILFGDNGVADASTNVLVFGNTITSVTSDAKGAYGISFGNTTVAQSGITIKGNTISTLTGGWVHAIGVEGNAPNLNINHNTISSLSSAGTDIKGVWFESEDTSFASALVNRNSLDVGATTPGIAVDPTLTTGSLDGTCNWWGNASGPGSVGSGTGSLVTAGVTYTPWLTTTNLDGDCGGGIATFKVHILKYLSGAQATAASASNYQFPMASSWNASNIGAGSGTYVLGNNFGGAADQYGADTAGMTAPFDYTTSEVVDTAGSQVVSSPALCSPGKYYLDGYTSSAISFADAAAMATSSTPAAFTGSLGDQYVIVWNNPCPTKGSLIVEKDTIGGNGTFKFTGDGGIGSFQITTTGTASGGSGTSQTFNNLTPGTYHIIETAQSGWTQTDTECSAVIVSAGNTTICTVTNTKNAKLGEIRGSKFEDWDGDGKAFERRWEIGLAGFTIYLDTNNNNQLDSGEPSTVTDTHGNYHFTGLTAGTYHVREVQKSGWTQTFPSTNFANDEYNITLGAGQIAKNKDFGNFKLGTISGMKYNDANGNGRKDKNENGLSGWTIQLKKGGSVIATATTDSSGNYSFANLGPGVYTLAEVMKSGWKQTDHPQSVRIVSAKVSKNNNFGNKQTNH